MVSISNFQGIEVSTDDWMVHFKRYSSIHGLIQPFIFRYSDFIQIFFYWFRRVSKKSWYRPGSSFIACSDNNLINSILNRF